MLYTLCFYTNRCYSWNKPKFVADEWKCYKGVHRYTNKQRKRQTNLWIIFFQPFYYFFSKLLGNIVEFPTIYKLPDLLFKFPTFFKLSKSPKSVDNMQLVSRLIFITRKQTRIKKIYRTSVGCEKRKTFRNLPRARVYQTTLGIYLHISSHTRETFVQVWSNNLKNSGSCAIWPSWLIEIYN